jgi:hypothetical protein
MSKNLPASVRQRLTNKAKETNRPFQELLQYFAMERFLYRLAQSPHAQKFILKGALMFTAWGGPQSRPTKDIDLLARMDNAVEVAISLMREVCSQAVEPDGLVFDVESVAGEAIKEDADYSGVLGGNGRLHCKSLGSIGVFGGQFERCEPFSVEPCRPVPHVPKMARGRA